MSKVLGLHMFALRSGVKAEDFERFVVEESYPVYDKFPGMDAYLLKGDRGDREGKYLVLFSFASVEARDRLFPVPGETSEEFERLFAPYTAVLEKWGTFASHLDGISTDYVVVGK